MQVMSLRQLATVISKRFKLSWIYRISAQYFDEVERMFPVNDDSVDPIFDTFGRRTISQDDRNKSGGARLIQTNAISFGPNREVDRNVHVAKFECEVRLIKLAVHFYVSELNVKKNISKFGIDSTN